MEALIRVEELETGRIVAKIEPLGPVAEADSVTAAIESAKRLYEASVRQQARWLPPGVTPEVLRYRVIGTFG